jgi:hypothetical protein
MLKEFEVFLSRDIEKCAVVEAASRDAAKHAGYAWLQKDRNRHLFLSRRFDESPLWTMDCTPPPEQFMRFREVSEPPPGSFHLSIVTSCCYPILVEADSYVSALVQGSRVLNSPEFRQYALDLDTAENWDVYAFGPKSAQPPSRGICVKLLQPLKRLVQCLTARGKPNEPDLRGTCGPFLRHDVMGGIRDEEEDVHDDPPF